MSPEEHVAAIEAAHREHEERLREMLTDLASAFAPDAPVQPSPAAIERQRVRNLFVESCGAIEALAHMAKMGVGHVGLVAEVNRWGALRAKLLELDA